MLAFLITEAMARTYGKLIESLQVRNKMSSDSENTEKKDEWSGKAGVI